MNATEMEPLIGTWFVDLMPFGEDGILVITKEGRAVQFPTSLTPPEVRQTMKLWMSPDVDGIVRVRPTPTKPGWLRKFEKSDSGWTIIAIHENTEHRFHCRPASVDTLPSWFNPMLEENLQYMVELEAQQDASLNQPAY